MRNLLDIESQKHSMKLIYSLAEDLKSDPEYVQRVQTLTLDNSRPLLGLKGTHGLFGSDQWWDAIFSHRMKLKFVSGVITETYYAGMDSDRRHNSYELVLDDGSTHHESFYANDEAEKTLYELGKAILAVYALDELKNQGRDMYSRTPIEIAISNDVVPL